MMTAEQAARFERYVTHVFYDAVALVRRFAPRDTGNLADKALKCEWQTDRRESWQRKFVIWVDTSGSTGSFGNHRKPLLRYSYNKKSNERTRPTRAGIFG